MLIAEQQVLRALDMSYKILYKEKFEFYTQGPSKETAKQKPLRWTGANSFPAKGLSSSKKEIDTYVEADEDVIKVNLKIGTQREKIQLLESILGMITNRSFQIKHIIDWEKYRGGA